MNLIENPCITHLHVTYVSAVSRRTMTLAGVARSSVQTSSHHAQIHRTKRAEESGLTHATSVLAFALVQAGYVMAVVSFACVSSK